VIALGAADGAYPAGLRDLQPAPTPLWVAGDPAVLALPAVAIVGTRRMSPYGERVAAELAAALAVAGIVVVSGLAQGIDTAAHRAALDRGGRGVAVLGEGLTSHAASVRGRRRVLARRLEATGALVSQYAPELPPQGWMFAKRNALIAALAGAVVIVEAPFGSGALITAADARSLGRPLYAVPGPLGARGSEGTNGLIANGLATALVGPAVLVARLGSADAAPAAGARAFDALLELLASGPADFDELADRVGGGRAVVRSRIVSLLLEGRIRETGDGRFARI
jgi:DNA processing protein